MLNSEEPRSGVTASCIYSARVLCWSLHKRKKTTDKEEQSRSTEMNAARGIRRRPRLTADQVASQLTYDVDQDEDDLPDVEEVRYDVTVVVLIVS